MGTMPNVDTESKPRKKWFLRPSRLDRKRMERLQELMDTQSESEVIRRAIEVLCHCKAAKAVWVEVQGEVEKQRMFID